MDDWPALKRHVHRVPARSSSSWSAPSPRSAPPGHDQPENQPPTPGSPTKKPRGCPRRPQNRSKENHPPSTAIHRRPSPENGEAEIPPATKPTDNPTTADATTASHAGHLRRRRSTPATTAPTPTTPTPGRQPRRTTPRRTRRSRQATLTAARRPALTPGHCGRGAPAGTPSVRHQCENEPGRRQQTPTGTRRPAAPPDPTTRPRLVSLEHANASAARSDGTGAPDSRKPATMSRARVVVVEASVVVVCAPAEVDMDATHVRASTSDTTTTDSRRLRRRDRNRPTPQRPALARRRLTSRTTQNTTAARTAHPNNVVNDPALARMLLDDVRRPPPPAPPRDQAAQTNTPYRPSDRGPQRRTVPPPPKGGPGGTARPASERWHAPLRRPSLCYPATSAAPGCCATSAANHPTNSGAPTGNALDHVGNAARPRLANSSFPRPRRPGGPHRRSYASLYNRNCRSNARRSNTRRRARGARRHEPDPARLRERHHQRVRLRERHHQTRPPSGPLQPTGERPALSFPLRGDDASGPADRSTPPIRLVPDRLLAPPPSPSCTCPAPGCRPAHRAEGAFSCCAGRRHLARVPIRVLVHERLFPTRPVVASGSTPPPGSVGPKRRPLRRRLALETPPGARHRTTLPSTPATFGASDSLRLPLRFDPRVNGVQLRPCSYTLVVSPVSSKHPSIYRSQRPSTSACTFWHIRQAPRRRPPRSPVALRTQTTNRDETHRA